MATLPDLPQVLPDILSLLPLISAPDNPPLPSEVLALSVSMRHELLNLSASDDKYFQAAPMLQVSQILEAMRESNLENWQLSRPLFQIAGNETRGVDVYAQSRIFSDLFPHSLLILMSIEQLEPVEQAITFEGTWRFYNLTLPLSKPDPAWKASVSEAYREHQRQALDDSSQDGDYWGKSSDDEETTPPHLDVRPVVKKDRHSSFLEIRSVSPSVSSFQETDGFQVDLNPEDGRHHSKRPSKTTIFSPSLASFSLPQPSPSLPVPSSTIDEKEVIALREGMSGLLNLFILQSSSPIQEVQESRKRLFLEVAQQVVNA